MHRLYHIAGWGYVTICSVLLVRSISARGETPPEPRRAAAPAPAPIVAARNDAQEWFRRVKPYCNSVELRFVEGSNPPETWQGSGYLASCYALAGKIDQARKIIDAMPEQDRQRAAGIVFGVGHPVADAGDDRAAGPIMELVIDYWPNHYMALYHAGIAEYMLGQSALARKNLTEFLRYYREDDGWTHNARDILRRLDDPSGAGAKDLRRPVEP